MLLLTETNFTTILNAINTNCEIFSLSEVFSCFEFACFKSFVAYADYENSK